MRPPVLRAVALLAGLALGSSGAAAWWQTGVVGGIAVSQAVAGVGRTGTLQGPALRDVGQSVVASTVFLVRTGRGGGTCSGTLVHPRVVLTAAHCLAGGGSLVVLFGADQRAVREPLRAEHRRMLDAVVHPGYARARQQASGRRAIDVSEAGNDVDLALVLLHRAAPEGFRPVRLADPGLRDSGALPKVVAGFGHHDREDAGIDGLLRLAEVRGSTRAYRKDWDGEANVMETRTGADGLRVSACFGDSGGPVFVRSGTALRQIGVTSAGDGRCREVTLSADIDAGRAVLRQMFEYLTAGTPDAAANPF